MRSPLYAPEDFAYDTPPMSQVPPGAYNRYYYGNPYASDYGYPYYGSSFGSYNGFPSYRLARLLGRYGYGTGGTTVPPTPTVPVRPFVGYVPGPNGYPPRPVVRGPIGVPVRSVPGHVIGQTTGGRQPH